MSRQHALEQALAWHRAGQWAQAEKIYRRILAADSQQADSLHFLGIVAHQTNRPRESVDLIRRAISLRITEAAYYISLGSILDTMGQSVDAIALYRRATQIVPGHVDAHGKLGDLFRKSGDLDRALAQYEQALCLDPANSALLLAVAGVRLQIGEESLEQAAGAARRLLDAQAPLPEAVALAWTIDRRLGRCEPYFSQFGQDRYLHQHVFKGMTSGTFVDIGAFDGVEGSNTVFFEKFLGWRGLCVEPDPVQFSKLSQVRSAICVQCCIAATDGSAEFLRVMDGYRQMGGLLAHYDPALLESLRAVSQTAVVSVPTRRLETLLDDFDIGAIDYLSIDVEGAELSILRAIDFDRLPIGALSVENNRHSAIIAEYMESRGYRHLIRLGVDDLFVKAGTTLIG